MTDGVNNLLPENFRSKRQPTGKSRARPQPLEIKSDFGPVLARVVVEDAADPDAPNRTIRRARRAYHYHEAHRRGWLSDEQREAADKFLILRERAEGANDGNRAPARLEPWQKGHPAEVQLAALTSLRRVRACIGNAGEGLLIAYVERNEPIAELAARRQMDREKLGREVRAALQALADMWGM